MSILIDDGSRVLVQGITGRDGQFHPERMRGDAPNPAFGPDGTELFKYFVDLC